MMVEKSMRLRCRRSASGWYLGEGSFKDKLLGVIDKAGARLRKKGNATGAAVRGHGEIEAEWITGLVGATLEMPRSMEELGALRKGNPRRVICAALVEAHTSMNHSQAPHTYLALTQSLNFSSTIPSHFSIPLDKKLATG